jgi:hypothetical protein
VPNSAPKPGHGRVIFDARFWADDLASSTPQGRTAAQAWRAAVEHDGVALSQLRACDPDARDCTRLIGCAKVYIPPPAGDWGAVLRLAHDDQTGRSALYVIAYGLRHPPPGRRASVYQLAHRRLHPPRA